MPKQTYQELIEHNIRDDAVLQSIGDGLIVIVDVNKGGKIVYVNKVFEDMTGWKLDEVRNKPVIDVLPREDKNGKTVPFKERIVTKVLSGKKVVTDLTEPFYYIRKDKSKFPVASVITPIILNKKIVGAVETFRDISKENQVDKAKTEFASLVSHQLRTPFSTINWYVELLLSKDVGKLNEKQTQYLEEAYRASKRMVNLINVLLSVSRIEMGTTIIEKKPTDVVKLALTILEDNQPEIKRKGLKVRKIYDKNIPKIQIDPKQLSMVFQNLFSNATKYTHRGDKITLKIKKQKGRLLIVVADTGMGIPKAAQPNIFDRFFRADNAKAQEPEGIGLGLYILKAIADQMNSKIWFESEENKGTTFYVSIPRKEVAE
ncbi:MAG: PAS domain-containing sensor histidine kinase [Candidatus Daviesbacteria bacterium]|nr:PAS domain-containing sensor histidine kinase [Candidatus Daviesbacteria bacterium]